jgi:hypothetical protein
MITLFRYWLYKSKEIKWKCALWMELDKQLTNLAKNPEEIEKKIIPYLAELIHSSVELEKAKMKNGEILDK